jgi:5'-nucleotidase
LKFGNGSKPDLIVSGPNEGNNAGPFLYTLSGTIGATYAGVERGVPGIAFSAGNSTHRSYTTINGTNDVAILNANASVSIVNQIGGSVQKGARVLPLGYGLNVNLPALNSTCSKPSYVFSRLTGGAIVDKAVLNQTSGIATFGNDINNPGLNTCISGDCSLPGETNVILGCSVSISVFTVDYDAPSSSSIRGQLSPLFGH